MKKGPSESPVPSPFPSAQWRLENKLQAQLDGAVPAGAEYGVERCVIRGGTTTTERTSLRRIRGRRLAIRTGAAIRILETGMDGNVGGCQTQLRLHPFP